MNNGKISSASEIFLSNIGGLNRQAREIFEARVCEISLYAETLAGELSSLLFDGLSLGEALSVIGRLDLRGEGEQTDSLIDASCYFKTLSSFDRAELSRQLVFRLSSLGNRLSLGELYATGADGSRVCYVRNALSDEAFDVFSQQSELSVGYVGSFDEAARAVRDGEFGYCILPLEEAGGVRSRRIMNMLRELSLKIVAVTPVFGYDGSADMKYALVSQGLCEPTLSGDDELYVDLLLQLGDSADMSGLLTGCQALGFLHTRSSQSVTPSGEAFTSLVLKADGGRLTELILYLTLFYEGFELIGVYKNLE